MRSITAAIALLVVLAALPAIASDELTNRVSQMKHQLRSAAPRPPVIVPYTHECDFKSASCNSNFVAVVNIYGCRTGEFNYFNVYRILIAANTRVTVSARSSTVRSFVAIFTDDSALNDVGADLKPINTAAVVTFDNSSSTSKSYLITVGPGDDLDTGSFTMSVTCTALTAGSCTPNSTTACMLNGRFRVTAKYRNAFDNAVANTTAGVKAVSGFANPSYETAFFYFNSENNIEVMIKVLDQGNTNSAGQPMIAVLLGSATPLRVEVTVVDTLKGGSKTYTSVFGSMAGTTDFTAFIK